MENKIEVRQILLNEFLNRWTYENVEQMTLEEYVDVRNRDTFCYWVETETRELGSIKGFTSIKFGIYKRKKEKRNEKPKNYRNDNEYSWLKRFGETREEAFRNIKKEILKLINSAKNGEFKVIDELNLPKLFRWKVAYLYSNERLLPIFSQEVLHRIAHNYRIEIDNRIKISKIQEIILQNKPVNITVQEFSEKLWNEFGRKEDEPTSNEEIGKKIRKSVLQKNTQPHFRKGSESIIAKQNHNLLQNNLKKLLVDKYGENAVDLESDYVDVKLSLSNLIIFYEVKSDATAEDCIKKALGQVLAYVFNNEDERKKKVVVVGQYHPSNKAKEFIEFIKKNLLVEFEYKQIDLEENL